MNLKAIKNTIKQNGGATLTHDMRYAMLSHGYMVSIHGYECVRKNVNCLTARLMRKYSKLAKQQNGFVGVWVDAYTGLVYVDISVCVNELCVAYDMGLRNKQLSIYDIKNDKVLYLK